jgi:hypothetical protein
LSIGSQEDDLFNSIGSNGTEDGEEDTQDSPTHLSAAGGGFHSPRGTYYRTTEEYPLDMSSQMLKELEDLEARDKRTDADEEGTEAASPTHSSTNGNRTEGGNKRKRTDESSLRPLDDAQREHVMALMHGM